MIFRIFFRFFWIFPIFKNFKNHGFGPKKRASALFFVFSPLSKHTWSGNLSKINRSFFFGPFWTVLDRIESAGWRSRDFLAFSFFCHHYAHKTARFFTRFFWPLGLCSGGNNWRKMSHISWVVFFALSRTPRFYKIIPKNTIFRGLKN